MRYVNYFFCIDSIVFDVVNSPIFFKSVEPAVGCIEADL